MGEDVILLPGQEGFVYKGPTYQELNEKLKSSPLVYNQIQQNIARRNNPTKEIVSYKDANGNTQHTTNVSAGVLSPVDPLAELYIAGKVLDPLFMLAGRAGEYGLARMGNNWARARILSRTLNESVPSLNISAPTSIIRTKLGDIEINNPELYYHQSGAGKSKNFVTTGRMRTPTEEYWMKQEHVPIQLRTGIVPGFPQQPGRAMFSQGNLWYGLNPNQYPDLLVTAKDMAFANSKGGYVSPNVSLSKLESVGTRRVTSANVGQRGAHTPENTTAYTWIPGYGYKKIQAITPKTSFKFYERPSKLSEAERLGIPKGERNQPFKAKVPTSHVQGEEAVKMFKEYGGEPIPEGSINGEQLRKYVAEARERYGLANNKNITDEEIAQALYKHTKELGGNTAAVNAQGEPQLLFRGDTKRFTEFKPKMSPEELANKRGTMDNSLGNLFLGEFPYEFRGVDRYIGTWRNFRGNGTLFGSGTGSKVKFNGQIDTSIEGSPYISPEIGGYKLYSHPHSKTGDILTVYKLPPTMMDSGVNDLNAFVVRTPAVRDATPEISVLNDDWLAQGAQGSTPHMRTKLIYDKDGFPLYQHPDGTTTFALAGVDNRPGMAEHYRYVLDDAAKKGEGLLRSNKNAPLRDEHSNYTYFALPNFNLRGIKHLLPYDLRIPRNWKDRNFYRTVVPLTVGGTTLHEITNQKQGGKMNIIEFLKNGSGIHIKKENRGKFTDYCGGKVTSECIAKGKRSSNPAIRKRATFADNARHFKHRLGGSIVEAFKLKRQILNSLNNMIND